MSSKIPEISDHTLLKKALTHRSYANENPDSGADNERLEFLGDAVLGFIAGEFVYQHYPHLSEAQLTRLRSILVNEKQLTKFARAIDLGQLMLLGKGAEQDHARESPALLSDTFEALIAAYFLDAGIEAVRQYLQPLLLSVVDNLISNDTLQTPKNLVDAKTRFQQWSLAKFGQNPTYTIIKESGPDHDKHFTAQVQVSNQVYGEGSDRRKQEAQKRAAEDALRRLGLVDISCQEIS